MKANQKKIMFSYDFGFFIELWLLDLGFSSLFGFKNLKPKPTFCVAGFGEDAHGHACDRGGAGGFSVPRLHAPGTDAAAGC